MELRGTTCEGGDWIELAHDWVKWLEFVNTVINLCDF
jgi:hypothetical protein